MGILMTELQREFPLNFIVAVYGNEHDCFCEYMMFDKDGRHMTAPRPLTMDALDNLYAYMRKHKAGTKTLYGRVPQRMLYMNPDIGYYVWTVPSATRELIATHEAYEKFEKKEFTLPNLVFAADLTTLSIFCYEGDELTDKTRLYPCPLYNVHNDGSLCTGSANVDRIRDVNTYDGLMILWENVMFRSKFSHGNDGHEELMQVIVNTGVFPWEQLKKEYKSDKRTLKSLFI